MATRSFNPDPELSKICTELWEMDENRFSMTGDIILDPQDDKDSTEEASDGKPKVKLPFFLYVNPVYLEMRDSFRTLIALFDIHEVSTDIPEEVTTLEVHDSKRFIDAVSDTKLMKRAHQYLASRGKMDKNEMTFRRQLYDMWFKLFQRAKPARVIHSSGFEHVFVGETRNHRYTMGFHNWVQYFIQEKYENIEYKGYTKAIETNDHLINIDFNWKRTKETKPPVGSTFVGTSPEFEVALYTIMYHCSPETHTDLVIAGIPVTIACYRNDGCLGLSYPIARSAQ